MSIATTNPPPKPEPPQNYDCCGGGCADCELKQYLKALAEWQRAQSAAVTAENQPAA